MKSLKMIALLLAAGSLSWGAGNVCNSPIIPHDDSTLEREFQNAYQCISNSYIPGKIGGIASCITNTNVTVTATTWTDTTLTCSITPKFVGDKILILVNQSVYGVSPAGGGTFADLRLLKGSTPIVSWIDFYINDMVSATFGGTFAGMYIDSPNSTSSVTYKTQGQNTAALGTIRFQVAGVPTSTMVLVDIVQ